MKDRRDETQVPSRHVKTGDDVAWFLSPEWQAKERAADQELASGKYRDFDSVDELLVHLDE